MKSINSIPNFDIQPAFKASILCFRDMISMELKLLSSKLTLITFSLSSTESRSNFLVEHTWFFMWYGMYWSEARITNVYPVLKQI